MQKESGEFKLKKADIILSAALIIISLALFFVFSPKGDAGNKAVVRVGGESVFELNLDVDGTFEIGDGNTCEVKDGKVTMIQADCPDFDCVKTGEIYRSGEVIVCLPNKVSITVISDEDDEIDAVAE